MTWTQTNAIVKNGLITPGWVSEVKNNIIEAADYNDIDTSQLLYSQMSASTNAVASAKNYIIAYTDINSISEAMFCGSDKSAQYITYRLSNLTSNNASNNSNHLGAHCSTYQNGHNYGDKDSHYDYCINNESYCSADNTTHRRSHNSGVNNSYNLGY